MITNVWLKSQPNKKISYPMCWSFVDMHTDCVEIRGEFNRNLDKQYYKLIAVHVIENISRIEFRP